jgi:indolepyruvate ferredoxin oxidoreductase alpha subunit
MAIKDVTGQQVLLGDEAVALGAVHAGITTAYAYPGTPSTEIVEYLVRFEKKHSYPRAVWTTNEKTALEEALGVSMVGRRSLVAMKHVGLNVAADPFMNAAIVDINGGVVVAVADDPGMHSSQNEQDSRYYADFGRVPCFEPTTQQQAYEMTREAFDISERFKVPVLMRLVTRLAHSRAVVDVRQGREQNPIKKVSDARAWTLLPANARRQWHELLQIWPQVETYSEKSEHNPLEIVEGSKLGVITCGIADNYYRENLADMAEKPSHLHIGFYPFPVQKIRELAAAVERIVILEEGYPYLERYMRGVFDTPVELYGKLSGHVPIEGELTPESVRSALGLRPRVVEQSDVAKEIANWQLPNRPPQLCQGCPHGDTYAALKNVINELGTSLVTSDIGCYTLGALPPYDAIESCVCMGASVSMAKGAADAGFHPAFAVIGDSTFLHSGVTPLMDAVSVNAPMTLIIVDNETVAMTGGQPTVLPSSRLEKVVLGIGVPSEHVRVMRAHPRDIDKIENTLREEMEYLGTSVVILYRECLETIKVSKKRQQREKQQAKQAKPNA